MNGTHIGAFGWEFDFLKYKYLRWKIEIIQWIQTAASL